MKTFKKFFAVTRTSVWEVLSDDGTGNPRVKKIKLFGPSPSAVGTILYGGNLVCVGRLIVVYNPAGTGRTIRHVQPHFWGGRTPPIVGLFECEREAQHCFFKLRLCDNDPRWREETNLVMKKIGYRHPVFTLADCEPLMLVP